MSVTQSAQLPLMKIAAVAVIIFCGVGVAAMTGLIPGVSSTEKPAPTADAPATTTEAPPTETPAPVKQAAAEHKRVATPVRHEQVAAIAPVCAVCGTVTSVNPIEVKGEASGVGAVAGGIAGLVVGNQIGHGKGRTLAKIAGAAGGAYAGHEIEKNVKKTTQYDVSLRMDDGTSRTVRQASSDGLAVGGKVKIVDNTVVPN